MVTFDFAFSLSRELCWIQLFFYRMLLISIRSVSSCKGSGNAEGGDYKNSMGIIFL
jgi:hypothetical protein